MASPLVNTAHDVEWTFDEPPAEIRNAKMLLLTIGRVCVIGNWKGGAGQYFCGYAPLPKIPKDAVIPPTVYNGVRHVS